MKGIYYKTTVLLFCLITAFAQSQNELSKTWNKEFKLPQTGALFINNKYGDITVSGWEKEEVSVVIAITATHRKKENAKKLLERIQPDAKSTEGLIRITTEFKEKSKSFLSRYIDIANPFDFDKTNIQIDYKVFLPKQADLTITNKFGDVIIGGWNGNLDVNLQHGNLWVNESLKTAKIDLHFGKLHCKTIESGFVNLKNGNLTGEQLSNLKLSSSGSTLKIDKVENVDVSSSKDDIFIETCEVLDGEFKFSTIAIQELQKALIANLKVTDLKVKKITNPATTLKLNQEKSQVNINIANTAFTLTAVLEEGVLRIPKSMTNLKTKMIDNSKKLREINASYGKSPQGSITVKGLEGDIYFED